MRDKSRGVTPIAARSRYSRSKSRLANYLRMVADLIDQDQIASEPWAITMVLTGDTHHECLNLGHGSKAAFRGATAAGERYATGNGPRTQARAQSEIDKDREPTPADWAKSGL